MRRTVLPLLLLAGCPLDLPPLPDGGLFPAASCFEPSSSSVFVQRLSSPTAGCALQGQPTGVMEIRGRPGDFGGVLVVPPADAGTPLPLVVVFHGAGESGEEIRDVFQLEAAADGGAIFAYPTAPRGTWEVGARSYDAGLLSALISKIAGQYCVDPERIYAAGFSAGAVFTLFLGCNVPETFRAVGVVAGTDNRFSMGCCHGMVSAMFIHGTTDNTIPFINGHDAAERLLARDQCGEGSAPDGPYCSAYACPATEAVDFCQWRGGHNVPPWAGAEVWRFFSGVP